MKKKIVAVLLIALILIGAIVGIILWSKQAKNKPEAVLATYMAYINEGEYEKLYDCITEKSKEGYTQEEFTNRNKNIYQGIDLSNIKYNITETKEIDANQTNLVYDVIIQTEAGEISFSNETAFVKNKENEYEIEWSSNMIFPNLNNEDKVRVKETKAERGSILDRNGKMLAGKGVASSVGLVPGKMQEDASEDLAKMASLLDISVESIQKDLSASYVKEDTFVPVKTVSKNATELKEQLLTIKGVMITDKTVRVYPYAEATSHLVGYIQGITAEELEEKKDQGYDENSSIGKVGLERIWEERLRGENGYEIYIEDNTGAKKKTLLQKEVKNGENIKTTIDAELQNQLYQSIKEDKGFFVVLQPETGEMLALVSTPAYDSNDFVMGYSNNKWNSVQNDERNLLLNRFAQTWAPGSTFKAVTGAVGVTTGKINPSENFGKSGLKWQNNESWGDYYVTTLTPYSEEANLKNALIRSDNIYFAKAALKIGSSTFGEQLQKLGFGETMPFTIGLDKSQISNSGKIETEIGLADSGYGQGQILVNPVHMASIYSAFINKGNMILPYLEYQETPKAEYWKTNVFTEEAANTIKEDLLQVVESANGTAHDAKVAGVQLAGKTGTAEVQKSSTEDEGTELGWFNCFTVNSSKPMLIISMVENAETNGGSHYLISKIRKLF